MEFRNWYEQAEADLRTAENSFRSGDYYASVFWCQQAVEKSLKSLIMKNSGKLVRIHDLVSLGRMVKLPKNLLDKCKLLSAVYVETRYGIVDEEIPARKFGKKDSSEFLSIAEEVLKWLKKKI